MTEDLEAKPGRVFVGPIDGRVKLFVVKSVRRRKDGTVSSCKVTWEGDGVFAEANMTMPKDGIMRGYRRVTLSLVGLAVDLAGAVGSKVPTDAMVIVTRDRTGGGRDLFKV